MTAPGSSSSANRTLTGEFVLDGNGMPVLSAGGNIDARGMTPSELQATIGRSSTRTG